MNIISYNGALKKYWTAGSELELPFIGRDLKNKRIWTLGYVTKKNNIFPKMFNHGRKVIGYPGLIVQSHGSAPTDLELRLGC